ncbi:LOW QUALITY PROTEIN: UPF0415 protein C7orf25 homolog [Pollicipes pollicipes]|uniref:LOW QUALITY PROTEIN: UPF0415 protein C7orf25 homolog n=1 Tax=Pollicipes pollicipes TaxID=41117 RepID=UPI001884D6FB|nr:LOW QUALITY PROTEIN: UPF0415 protein C7orf25 homolog [Pollicipes pollicipes]
MGSDAISRLDQKVCQGQAILVALEPFSGVDGCDKFARKVRAELKFLQKLQRKPHTLKEDHLRSSNMDSLQAIADTLRAAVDVTAMLATFSCAESGQRVVVDVVAAGGAQWIKVISRNPAALQRVSLGQGEFGQRSAQEQAEQYAVVAQRNSHYFRPPAVHFVFSAGVGRRLAARLRARGVLVSWRVHRRPPAGRRRLRRRRLGRLLRRGGGGWHGGNVTEPGSETSPEVWPSVAGAAPPTAGLAAESGLNLDVTAMLAYVSNLTNGRCHVSFSEPVLAQQAIWEREAPVKPELDRLFADRELICCRSAERAFVSIVNTVGGPNEQRRADSLLRRVRVVEDMSAPAMALLAARGKVRGRSAAVFGTGEALRLPTVTANTGFVRAAAGQGVRLTAITHGSRALTEAKEVPAEAGGGGHAAGR